MGRKRARCNDDSDGDGTGQHQPGKSYRRTKSEEEEGIVDTEAAKDDKTGPDINESEDGDLSWGALSEEDEEDLVLSEVHIDPANGSARTQGRLRMTVFSIRAPEGHTSPCQEIQIFHEMATPLHSVGHQVWSGALLLCDYLLSKKHHIFTPDTVLTELGCGAGLVSVVAAHLCQKVYATDIRSFKVLDLCAENVRQNKVHDRVCVKEYDFFALDSPLLKDGHKGRCHGNEGQFAWSEEDIVNYEKNCTLLVAADVIYDDSITFALVERLYALLRPTVTGKSRTLYLALEKRIQFSLDDRDVVAPARDFFLRTLEAANIDRSESLSSQLLAEAIDVDSIPQWLTYTRTKELELWKLSLQSCASPPGL
ncbi:Methyltransferase-like protein 22 [Gaertneriomyces sp. JEL0708]|nr:Methyltransferase-like protein 22 [Gaertneriomyces sp. JEL0708]